MKISWRIKTFTSLQKLVSGRIAIKKISPGRSDVNKRFFFFTPPIFIFLLKSLLHVSLESLVVLCWNWNYSTRLSNIQSHLIRAPYYSLIKSVAFLEQDTMMN